MREQLPRKDASWLCGSNSRNAELGPPERISSPEEENDLLCVVFSSSQIYMARSMGP
jgi:hypothetical protein